MDGVTAGSKVMLGLLTRDGEVGTEIAQRVPLGPVRAEIRDGKFTVVNAADIEILATPPPRGVEIVAIGVYDEDGRFVRKATLASPRWLDPLAPTHPLPGGLKVDDIRQGAYLREGSLAFVMSDDEPAAAQSATGMAASSAFPPSMWDRIWESLPRIP